MSAADTTLAYIAGFIDGEGSIVIGRKYNIAVVAGQVDPRPLHLINRLYPGHLRWIARKHLGWSDYWHLTVHGTVALRMIRDILPYLVLKREQAEVPLLLQQIKRSGPRGGLRKKLSPWEVAERESYRLALLDLRAETRAA